jgi:hypothetical protein
MKNKLYTHLTLRNVSLFLIFIVPLIGAFVPSLRSMKRPFYVEHSVLNADRPTDGLTPPLFTPAVASVRREPLAGVVKVWSLFDPARFGAADIAHTVGTARHSARIPTTGLVKVDESIATQTRAFLATLPDEKSTDVTVDARVNDDVLFITLSAVGGDAFTTFSLDKDGVVGTEVLGATKDGPINEAALFAHATATLAERFPKLSREDATAAVRSAYEKKSYRLASNGLVLILPKKNLPGAEFATPYHEVLVPTSVTNGR